jgi:hypothetical protein
LEDTNLLSNGRPEFVTILAVKTVLLAREIDHLLTFILQSRCRGSKLHQIVPKHLLAALRNHIVDHRLVMPLVNQRGHRIVRAVHDEEQCVIPKAAAVTLVRSRPATT